MPQPEPIYTAANCRPRYRLRWSLSLFWRQARVGAEWLAPLAAQTEQDGVRILEHRSAGATVDQFLLSTTPAVVPQQIVRSVKGRLQHIIRHDRPKAFRRNYSICSIGPAKGDVVEQYIAGQVDHHPMADERVQASLRQAQIQRDGTSLSTPRRSAHGEFVYNLHLVFVHDLRWMEVREDVLDAVKAMVDRAATAKGHLLSHAGILPDHLHLALGCGIDESPEDVALSYLNNLAYAQGMREAYRSSYFVGTFGGYDLDAVRGRAGAGASLRRGEPGGGAKAGGRASLADSRVPTGTCPVETGANHPRLHPPFAGGAMTDQQPAHHPPCAGGAMTEQQPAHHRACAGGATDKQPAHHRACPGGGVTDQQQGPSTTQPATTGLAPVGR